LNLKSLNQQTVNNPREEPQIQLNYRRMQRCKVHSETFPSSKKGKSQLYYWIYERNTCLWREQEVQEATALDTLTCGLRLWNTFTVLMNVGYYCFS